MKLNLEDDNVFLAPLKLEEARALIDLELPEGLTAQLDEAQAYVHQGNGKAYLIIAIE